MDLSHLLLVDDSDAILNFEKAVLSGLYRLSTASNGVEALEKIKGLRPDGVLLDLSMPEMDGDEVLKIIKADPSYSSIPFLVISSEKDRAEACLSAGAESMLLKPVVAEDLKARVALMLEAVQERERKRSSAFLFLTAGPYRLGVPLACVVSVHSQPATEKEKSSSPYRGESVDLYGEKVGVLDLPAALGERHERTLEDRKLVFLQGKEKLALCVDQVWDPEELLPDQVHAASPAPSLPILSHVDSSRGRLPVVAPETFFSDELLAGLAKQWNGERVKR